VVTGATTAYRRRAPSRLPTARRPSARASRLAKADAVLVCVPTPLTRNREPDLGSLTDSTQALAEVLQSEQLVVLDSTTYPRNTREPILRILEESGLSDQLVRVSTPEAAELTKLLENIFRPVNIALVNELAMLTDRIGIDIWEVLDAASTKPYGFMRFEPGPGIDGHCLPVDPLYLSWRPPELDMSLELVELSGKVNQQMPYHCLAKIQRTLNTLGVADAVRL
jgi:UDP-N-acetyl-D-glucosamine dehydrogenase